MLIWWRSSLLTGSFEDEQTGLDVDWRPDLDILELPEEFLLSLSLPGVAPGDVEVTVAGRTLAISGVRRAPTAERAVAHLIESARGRFERRVRLPPHTETSRIRSQMAEGLLLLRVPKAPPRPIRVDVRETAGGG